MEAIKDNSSLLIFYIIFVSADSVVQAQQPFVSMDFTQVLFSLVQWAPFLKRMIYISAFVTAVLVVIVFRYVRRKERIAKKLKALNFNVSQLYIYPVKACAGIPVQSAEAFARGFKNDRRYMIIYPNVESIFFRISFCVMFS